MNSHLSLLVATLFLGGAIQALPMLSAPQGKTQDPKDVSQDGEKKSYVIKGDLSKSYVSGNFVLFVKGSSAAKSGGMTAAGGMVPATGMAPAAGMAPAKPKGSATPASSKKMKDEVGRATLKDGKFTLEGEVDQLRQAYFYVMDGVSLSGHRLAPTKGQVFILEPGELVMEMDDRHKFLISGGYFNDEVYNTWKKSSEYQDANASMAKAFRAVPGETKEEKDARYKRGGEIQNQLFDIEARGRGKVAKTHPNLLVRQWAIQTAWLGGRWQLEGAKSILQEDPDHAWAAAYVVREEERLAKRQRNEQIGRVGGAFKDFDANSIDGTTVSLSGVCAKNKCVLLEFWASWCGPCRSEIPHMKKAYAHYHDKGFEILSFTIDDKKEAWHKASKQEDMPWINTGFGMNSKPKKLCEVTGVPANYLIDGSTGKVIARNLRGDKLDAKLQELLGKP